MRNALTFFFAMVVMHCSSIAHAADAQLTVTIDTKTHRFSRAELLARSDAADITIPNDVSYGHAMTYRAVPLLGLLKGAQLGTLDTLEASATDGFVSQIPIALVKEAEKDWSTPWVAVEDPASPWPNLPGKNVSAGPFYLVWEHPERSKVGTEQWPYQLASLTATESPAHRWPQMAVDPDLPANAPARRGQAVFTVQCLPCHRMLGAGASDVGPDLGQPMNPVAYLTPKGLRMLIRNPKAVRTWPEMRMSGFDKAMLSDDDLDALVAYLKHMAERPH